MVDGIGTTVYTFDAARQLLIEDGLPHCGTTDTVTSRDERVRCDFQCLGYTGFMPVS
jgi:hypothetical protein